MIPIGYVLSNIFQSLYISSNAYPSMLRTAVPVFGLVSVSDNKTTFPFLPIARIANCLPAITMLAPFLIDEL